MQWLPTSVRRRLSVRRPLSVLFSYLVNYLLWSTVRKLSSLILLPRSDPSLDPPCLSYSGSICKICANINAASCLTWFRPQLLSPEIIISPLVLSSLINGVEQGHCGACRRKWRLTDTDLCPCGETQTMSHIVESCPLTKLNGGLSRLHSADEDSVSWLTNYGSWNAYEKKKMIILWQFSQIWIIRVFRQTLCWKQHCLWAISRLVIIKVYYCN